MDQETLVKEQIDAGAELVRRLDPDLPVTAALWLKDADDGRWYLYIASEQLTPDTGREWAYGHVLRVARELQEPSLNAYRIRLVGGDDPLTRTVLDLHRPYDGKKPIRYDGWWLGGINIDDTYLYPLPPATQAKLAEGRARPPSAVTG